MREGAEDGRVVPGESAPREGPKGAFRLPAGAAASQQTG